MTLALKREGTVMSASGELVVSDSASDRLPEHPIHDCFKYYIYIYIYIDSAEATNCTYINHFHKHKEFAWNNYTNHFRDRKLYA